MRLVTHWLLFFRGLLLNTCHSYCFLVFSSRDVDAWASYLDVSQWENYIFNIPIFTSSVNSAPFSVRMKLKNFIWRKISKIVKTLSNVCYYFLDFRSFLLVSFFIPLPFVDQTADSLIVWTMEHRIIFIGWAEQHVLAGLGLQFH